MKKSLFLALLSGLLFVFAWPVNGIPIFIFGAFVPLFWIEKKLFDQQTPNRYLKLLGWSYLAFGIWNLGTTWWLVNASVFGMVFAIACNSLFFSLLWVCFHWAKHRMPIRSAYLFLIALWMAFEKWHLSWDFSWPWLNLGHVFSETIHWIQWYEYTGVFGGTLWILLINVLLFEKTKSVYSFSNISSIVSASAPVLIGIALPIAYSLFLFQKKEMPSGSASIVLVQPNIDPYDEKYTYSNMDYLEQLTDLLKDIQTIPVDYVITPETYFAAGYGERLRGFEKSPFYQKIVRSLAQRPQTQLLTGIQFFDTYESDQAPTPSANKVRDRLWVDYYNSALAASVDTMPQIYHKSKLVVGVENMPYKKLFTPLLGSVLLDMGGTVSSRATQPYRSVFTHPRIRTKAAPIICYESIYGAFVTEYVQKGADFLAIITNDAWWGNTPGHKQLLSFARLRAIENRRTVARAANTGISAFLSPKGEILSSLPYEQKGNLTKTVSLYNRTTFYSQYGDYLARWSIFLSVLYFFLGLSGRLKENRK